jgi:hypothetical protein
MGVMNGSGMLEAGMGRSSCLTYANQLEQEPTHRVNALQLRMLFALWQADGGEAERCKRRVDRVRLENSASHWFESSHLQWEVEAYALSEDVMHLQQARQELASLARRYAAWRVVDQFAAAHHRLACGDPEAARIEIEAALSLTAPGQHALWVACAEAHVRILHALGRGADALGYGQLYLEAARHAELDYRTEHLRLTLAQVLASLGDASAAVSSADQALASLKAHDVSGLALGSAHESRARVASILGDYAAFETHARRCADIFLKHRHPPLIAKHDRLIRDAQRKARQA